MISIRAALHLRVFIHSTLLPSLLDTPGFIKLLMFNPTAAAVKPSTHQDVISQFFFSSSEFEENISETFQTTQKLKLLLINSHLKK